RLSMASSDEDIEKIREEIVDCYGFVPPELENLFEVIGIRNLLAVVKGKKMKGIKLTPDFKLSVFMPGLRASNITRQAKELLKLLVN
ncbi:MAG: TRCF domain-containing protein, partial [Syntrophales bacterium]